MRMRIFPVCLLSFVFLQPGLSPAALPGSEEWTRAQAIDEVDALVVIERLKRKKPADRMAQVRAWLTKLEATGLDLGEDAYVKAFALYLVTKKDEGPIIDAEVVEEKAN